MICVRVRYNRKEKILAVGKQIYNFLQWRNDYLIEKKNNFNYDSLISKLYVIGKKEDIEAIRNRVDVLIERIKISKSSEKVDTEYDSWECTYLPDILLENLICQTVKLRPALYLSPDASHTLSAKCEPPTVVIVGMLVDRKIQPNRSKSRAESLMELRSGDGITINEEVAYISTIKCGRLPLDVLNVSDLHSNEPLNIDTVLELMQRWWFNVNTKGSNQNSFVDAATRSLLTHRSRHPVRTIHGGAKPLK